MSRQAKTFAVGSVVASIGIIYGVHFLQQRESDTMYQGVLRDEKRVKEKALALLNHPIETLQDTLHSASSGPSGTHASPPLDTPSSPVSQPAPVMDEDCVTCKISPPPQLVEAQSKELRAKERQERLAEYEAQKSLGDRLSREQAPPRVQPAQAQESSRRLV